MRPGIAFRITTMIALCAALTFAGCGRRGALERPSGPVEPAVEKADPGAVNPQAPDKRFILDGLID